MILEEKVYEVPVITNENGHNLIDMSLIKLMLYAHSFGFISEKKKEKPLDVKVFKAKLNSVFMTSLAKGSYPWKNENTVIGEAPGFDMCFDVEKINENKDDIKYLINCIGDFDYFSDLRLLKDGQEWTTLLQDIKKLLALATAARIIDYRTNTNNMYDDNPVLRRTNK